MLWTQTLSNLPLPCTKENQLCAFLFPANRQNAVMLQTSSWPFAMGEFQSSRLSEWLKVKHPNFKRNEQITVHLTPFGCHWESQSRSVGFREAQPHSRLRAVQVGLYVSVGTSGAGLGKPQGRGQLPILTQHHVQIHSLPLLHAVSTGGANFIAPGISCVTCRIFRSSEGVWVISASQWNTIYRCHGEGMSLPQQQDFP